MLKFNKKYRFLLKITLIVFISFLIAATVMWIFFRSTARNIGYYLATGRKNTAVVLITEYLGNPPSKLKARILSNFYDISFEYFDNGKVKWSVGKKLEFIKGMHFGGKSTMMNKPLEHMRRMMRGMFKKDVYLGDKKMISIYFPIYPHGKIRKIFIFPIIIIFLVIISIAILIFFIIKRTLLPIQALIEASHRIGNGDLSYRLVYKKNDEFANVVNAFNIMAGKLEDMLRSQRELLHMISHELRTPLTRINLALELDNFEKSKEIIRDEIKEINELIESIIGLSRLDNEQIGIEKSDLVKTVKKIIGKYKNINIDVRIAVESAWLKCNKILLEKAIGNIIENAVKYSDKKDPIFIELFRDDDHYVFKVINSGKGIDNEEIKNIFKPFYRGKNATESYKEGKGLGLVVAKRIIETIGGNIECESSKEGPTKFVLRIPVIEKII